MIRVEGKLALVEHLSNGLLSRSSIMSEKFTVKMVIISTICNSYAAVEKVTIKKTLHMPKKATQSEAQGRKNKVLNSRLT